MVDAMTSAYILLALALYGQKYTTEYTLPTPAYTFVQAKPIASVHEHITKDGHYVFTFDDPNNEWRCYGLPPADFAPHAVQIVCTRHYEVEKDK